MAACKGLRESHEMHFHSAAFYSLFSNLRMLSFSILLLFNMERGSTSGLILYSGLVKVPYSLITYFNVFGKTHTIILYFTVV